MYSIKKNVISTVRTSAVRASLIALLYMLNVVRKERPQENSSKWFVIFCISVFRDLCMQLVLMWGLNLGDYDGTYKWVVGQWGYNFKGGIYYKTR
jgi:hypothetical protein